jgi:hypothetical protein
MAGKLPRVVLITAMLVLGGCSGPTAPIRAQAQVHPTAAKAPTLGECSTTRLVLTNNGQPDTPGGSMEWDFALTNKGLPCTLPTMWLSGEATPKSFVVKTASFNEPTSLAGGATAHFVLVDGVLCGFVLPDPDCVKVSNIALRGLDHPLSLGLTFGMLPGPGATLGIRWSPLTAR